MDKTFDDLLNEFFKNSQDGSNDDLKEEAKKMIDMLKNLDNITKPIDEILEKEMDGALGEPDLITYYEEDGLFFEKRSWATGHGNIVKLIVSDVPLKPIPKPSKETLEKQLNEALEKEDYEMAAQIRDLINPKKKVGRPRKK